MKSSRFFLLLLLLGVLEGSIANLAQAHPGHDHAAPGNRTMRTWTTMGGARSIEASFVAQRDGQVQLRQSDGRLLTLAVERLGTVDQRWLDEQQDRIRQLNERPVATPIALAPAGRGGDEASVIAKAFDPFVKLKAITTRVDAKFFYVESNGMPAHPLMVGIRAWQQQVPLPQKYVGENAWRIPLEPQPAAEPASTKDRFLRGAIALAVNGIPIFNPLNNRGDDAYLFGELDEYGGHCGRADDYHYHLAPVHLEKQVGKGGILAYALDGYPIYGYEEPDGSKVVGLDKLGGHKDADGRYHYHATKTYPYLNGGFYGQVVEREGQVDPQPRAEGVRPALTPLRDAKITGFTETQPGSYRLTYDVKGKKGTVSYTIAADGSVKFDFVDPAGKSTSETYTPRRRGPGGKPPREKPGEREKPPREKPRGEGKPPRGEAPPKPDANERPARTSDTSSRPGVGRLVVTSDSVGADGKLSIDCTCDGQGQSPAVAWQGLPAGTKSVAISLWHVAPDQEKSYWVVYDIPADVEQLKQNARGVGTLGVNDKRRAEYDPMCSKGPGRKTYHVTVYALSAPVKLAAEKASRAHLLATIKDVTLAEGTLDFVYERKR